MEAFQRKTSSLSTETSWLVEEYKNFLQKRIPLIFSGIWAPFSTDFSKQHYTSSEEQFDKNKIFREFFFSKNFQIFRRGLELWPSVLGLVAATFPLILIKLPSRCQKKTVCFQSCFRNMNEHRLKFGGNGKQWVRRRMFCPDDFLSITENGRN